MVRIMNSTTVPREKVALVTGAASGIGRATVSFLLNEGWCVWAADLREINVAENWPEFADKGRLYSGQVDVTNEDSVAALMELISNSNDGQLDGLVNSAGIVVVGKFEELSVADWDNCYRVNLLGSFLMIKHAIPMLRASGRGRVVNLSSMSGKTPNLYTAPYGAAKAGVISLTRSAAVALAPLISVNCVCPGIIDTAMWKQLNHDFKEVGAKIEFESRAADAPIGRPGSPDEVATAIGFLLSEASSFVTGEDLNVSGGMIMF